MTKKDSLIGRIRYTDNYRGREAYIFETRWTNESDDSYGIEKVFYVDEHDKINYQALTQIREWQRIGIKKIVWA